MKVLKKQKQQMLERRNCNFDTLTVEEETDTLATENVWYIS